MLTALENFTSQICWRCVAPCRASPADKKRDPKLPLCEWKLEVEATDADRFQRTRKVHACTNSACEATFSWP